MILQQLDNITHDLDIKESTTAKHRKRMKQLDTMTNKLSAVDEQLQDCKRILTIVDKCLQKYSEQIMNLAKYQQDFDLLLGINQRHFERCINNLKEFSSKVNSWQSDVEKRSSELQRETSSVLQRAYNGAAGAVRAVGETLGGIATGAAGGVVGAVHGAVGGAVGGVVGGVVGGEGGSTLTIAGSSNCGSEK